MYGLLSGNASESRQQYSLRFPKRRTPNVRTSVRVHQCLAENGRFRNSNRSVGNFVQDMSVEEAVLDRFNKGPRESARTENCSYATVVSQNTYKEKDCIVEIHLKELSFVPSSLARPREFPSNNSFVDR